VGHPLNAYLFPYQFLTAQFAKVNGAYQYQLGKKNEKFIQEINKAFKKTDNLLILSRDGTRSALAARDLVQAGFKKVFDVEDGFEGAEFPNFKDDNRHKFYRQLAKRHKIPAYRHRRHSGWQYWGLPWTYDLDPKFIYPPDLEAPKK
jgi:rhodanese-related sulfurtransferase